MIQTLIPLLLVADIPIDVYDIYYGSQFIFNLSNTMEYNFGDSRQHVNIVAKLKCHSFGNESLICSVTNASKQWYEEQVSLHNAKYINFPIFNTDPFQIFFNNKGKIDAILVDDRLVVGALENFIIIQIAQLLNIHWIDVNESEKGTFILIDNTLEKHGSDGDCQKWLVKMTRQKKKDNNKKLSAGLAISSVGKRVSIISHMILNFKKTLLSNRSCFNNMYLFYDKYDNIQLKVINVNDIKSQSFYNRVIVSNKELVSITETLVNYCSMSIDDQAKCHNNIYQKMSITLDFIEKSSTEPLIPAVSSINILKDHL